MLWQIHLLCEKSPILMTTDKKVIMLTQDLEIEREATGRGLFLERVESERKRLDPIVTRFPPSAKSGQTDYQLLSIILSQKTVHLSCRLSHLIFEGII